MNNLSLLIWDIKMLRNLRITSIVESDTMTHCSIEQLKNILKTKIKTRANDGELFVSEILDKKMNQQDLKILSEDFKQAGYKVKIKPSENHTIFSIYWD